MELSQGGTILGPNIGTECMEGSGVLEGEDVTAVEDWLCCS